MSWFCDWAFRRKTSKIFPIFKNNKQLIEYQLEIRRKKHNIKSNKIFNYIF